MRLSHKMAPGIPITDHEVKQSKYRQKHLFPPFNSSTVLFRLHSVEIYIIPF